MESVFTFCQSRLQGMRATNLRPMALMSFFTATAHASERNQVSSPGVALRALVFTLRGTGISARLVKAPPEFHLGRAGKFAFLESS
jgi:hypothetical protein